MGPSRSLHIGDDPSADAGSERVRDVPVRSTAVGPQNAPEAPSVSPKRKPRPVALKVDDMDNWEGPHPANQTKSRQ